MPIPPNDVIACVTTATADDFNNMKKWVSCTSNGHRHDGTNGRIHATGDFKLKESSGCYYYAFATSNIAANRNVTLPALTTNGTFSFLEMAQSFTAAQIITTDADSEFVALKLTNQSDSANTCGFVTLEFDLEDTGGNAVDAAKISVKKEASFTATASTQDAKMEFALSLNGTMTERMTLASTGNLSIDGDLTVSGGDITVGATTVISGGDTTSLDNIDVLNATTEATIEGAIDTLSNLGTIGKACATTNIVAGDITMYNAVNNGNPSFSIGSSSAERFVITPTYTSGAQLLDYVKFSTVEASSTSNRGKYIFDVDGTDILTIDDGGIDLASGKTFAINGSDISTSDTTYTAGDGLGLSGTTFSTDLVTNGGLEIASNKLQVTDGIGQYAVAQYASGVADNDFLRIDGTAVEGRSASEVLSDISAAPAAGSSNILTTGALDSGSITSGFGAIDNGCSGIRTNTFTVETSIVPDASGGADIGTTSLEWGDVYIADDKKIYLGSGQDVSLEYDEDGTDELRISGNTVFVNSVDHTLDAHFDSTPADETVSGITATFTAGEDLSRGEVVYYKPGDSKMWKAVATAAATSRCVAMAAADVSADAPGKFLLKGFLMDNGTFPAYTAGDVLYTPEAAAPDTDGDFVQIIGWAVDANTVYFNPDSTVIEVA